MEAALAIAQPAEQPANILSIPRSFFLLTEEQFKRIQFMAKMYAMSSFNAGDDKKSEGDYFILMIKGVELGMSLTAAVEFISVIKGKPCVDGKGMLALIRNSSKCKSLTIDSQEEYCKVTGTRSDTGDTHSEIWTIEDARKFMVWEKTNGQGGWKPLADRQQWKSQQKTMLKWRAVAAFGRAFFSDVLGGLYSKEEMLEGDAIVTDSGEMTAAPVATKWYQQDNGRALHELSERAYTAGLIEERNGKGIALMEALIAPRSWDDFADRASAGVAVKEAAEAKKAAAQPAPAVTPEPDTGTPAPVAQSPFADTLEAERKRHNEQLDAEARQIAESMGSKPARDELDAILDIGQAKIAAMAAGG